MLGIVRSIAMAPRANWKGFLKLPFVSCNIAMVQATSTRERIRFNIINRDTGNRVRYRLVDAETGEEVPQEDRVRGYKAADGSYMLLNPEELDEVALESTHTIDIEAFVRAVRPRRRRRLVWPGLQGPSDTIAPEGAQGRWQKQAP
jgi:non-homologous end joining protein Ku